MEEVEFWGDGEPIPVGTQCQSHQMPIAFQKVEAADGSHLAMTPIQPKPPLVQGSNRNIDIRSRCEGPLKDFVACS